MTIHLAALAAVTDVLTAQPLPSGASLSVNLYRYDHTDELGLGIDLHTTPRAITEAITDALRLTEQKTRLVRRDGTSYRTVRYGNGGDTAAHHYGPELTEQARRTASRGDVRRCMA